MSEHTYGSGHTNQAILNAAELLKRGKSEFYPSELTRDTGLPKWAEEDFCDHLVETGFFKHAGLTHFSLTEKGEKMINSVTKQG